MLQTLLPLKDLLFGSDNPVKAVADTPADFISSVLPTFFILAGFILFVYLVFGGFTIVMSAGDSEGVDKGKQSITNAIIGFIVIFASYWIIELIQIVTGIPIMNATGL